MDSLALQAVARHRAKIDAKKIEDGAKKASGKVGDALIT
jgi:hypothetical protein